MISIVWQIQRFSCFSSMFILSDKKIIFKSFRYVVEILSIRCHWTCCRYCLVKFMFRLKIQITYMNHAADIDSLSFLFFFFVKYNCFDNLSYIFIMILLTITNSQLILRLMRVLHAHSVYFRLIWFSFSFLFLTVLLHSLVIHNDAFVRCGGIGRTSEEGK